MNLMKATRALAAIALATIGFAFPAEAAVTYSWSAGATCGNPATASFSTSGPTFQASLCATTTTERGCGFSAVLQANSAVQSNAFSVTARTFGTSYTDPNAAPTLPLLIANPPTAADFGATIAVGASSALAGANQLLATFTFQPQASATLASYVINLSPVSEFDTDQGDITCGSSANSNAALPSLTLNISTAPAFTSAATTTFTVAAAGTFNVTATGAPAPTFSATGALPGGVTLTSAGVLAGTPASGSAGTYPLTITAANGNLPNATQSFSLVVAKRAQTITFNTIANQAFSASPFTISGVTASSGLAPTFSSSTTGVCTVAGSVVTFVTGGTCTITANQAGNADFNAAAAVAQSFTISASAPAAPTIGAGTPGNLSATVAFTAPANNGGSAIIDFTATCAGTPVGTVTGTASPLTVTGLTNGNTYSCTVVARNAVGTSPASAAVSVVPSPVPVPPAFTNAATANFAFGVAGTFTFTATGSPPPTFTTASALPGLTLTSAGVLSGTPNAAGTFQISVVATGTAPAATQAFTLVVAKANQTITFGAITGQPFNASPIALTATTTATGLTVTFTSSTPAVCTVAGASVSFLSAGTCTIVADQAGNTNFNAATAVTQSFTVSASAPGAPTIGTGQPGNLRAIISFAAPAVTGGSAILDYTATCTGGAGGSATGTTSPITVTGLVNGTTYACSVRARNAAGLGLASATVNVTPAPIVPPAAPTITSGAAGNGQAVISFDPSLITGGSPVTGFTVTCNPGAITATGSSSPITVVGLTNNTTYTCSVSASNVSGTGATSATVTVTPMNAPIMLTSTTNVAAYGAPVTLIASVTGNGQTGTVAFSVDTGSANGAQVLAGCSAVRLVAGFATCLAPGRFQNQNPRSYVATYSGDTNNGPASISFAQVVATNAAVLSVSANPLPPVVSGRTTTLSALVKMASPAGSVTFFDNGVPVTGCTQTAITILPDATDSAVANCTLVAPTAASGVKQYVATYFYPAGHVSGRVFEQATFDLRVTATGPADYTDMWWAGASENGWGMSVTQHGPIQFNVIFAYDNLGKSLWYVMPGGSFNAAGTVFTGALYLPASSPFSAYDASKFAIGASVGSATITYTSSSTATLAYTINGVSATKSIQRQVFGTPASGPATISTQGLLTNDLWWGSIAENGWGMNIAQQGRVLFPVWYTYDAAGKATFFTGQGGSWSGTTWTGTIFAHESSAWLGVPYNPALFKSTNVGTITLDFSDASNATMSTSVNGIVQSRRIERQPY